MHFILLKYIHNIIRYMCFYKNRLNLPRSPLSTYIKSITRHETRMNKTKRKNRIYIYNKKRNELIMPLYNRYTLLIHYTI